MKDHVMKGRIMKSELRNIVRLKKHDEWHRLNTKDIIDVNKIKSPKITEPE
jgi:hypothetical protein